MGEDNAQTGMFEIETGLYKGYDMTPPSVVLVENEPVFPPTETNNGPAVDSLFWTQSAVFKFMIPYYVPFLKPERLEQLKDFAANPAIVAIGHRYPTEYDESPGKYPYMSAAAVELRLEPELSDIVFGVRMPSGRLQVMTWADYITNSIALVLATPLPSEPAASDEPKKEP